MEKMPATALVGRVLMTLATLVYGVAPPFADFNETHVLHPQWTPHARLHMVWLIATNSALAVMALYFLWLHRGDRALGARLAGLLGLCALGGFWIAAATMPLYGGALKDVGGVPLVLGLDGNLLAFSSALLLLLTGWALANRGR